MDAAIGILDAILAGARAEAALISWGRASRYAGSGDRAAVRDLVFQALRRRRSAAWEGGSDTGRGLMLGLLRIAGRDPAGLFTGGRAPPPPGPDEAGRRLAEAPRAVRLDCPDWLMPRMAAALGADTDAALAAGQERGPVFLRVNLHRASREHAAAALAADGIVTRLHPEVASALEVLSGARRLAVAAAGREGLVEPMDAHSQAVVLALGEVAGLEVLDYCAGGGGKALHLADLGARVTAHDAFPRRMRDLAPRAARAGVHVGIAGPDDLSMRRWPLVVVDAPCSGSGTWRRDPEGKWMLTPARLAELAAVQDRILARAAAHVAPGGRLAFITCSVLDEEGPLRDHAFVAAHPGWHAGETRRFLPGAGGDGFHLAIHARSPED